MYKWEAEARKKYSDETVNDLLEQQRKYERQKEGNDCQYCGKNNQGAITLIHDKPYIIHYGMFKGKKCDVCGRINGKDRVDDDKHVIEINERNQTHYLSAESHYYDLAEAAGQDDAILFEVGHMNEGDRGSTIDNVVTTNVENARKFAKWILELCDDIERNEVK